MQEADRHVLQSLQESQVEQEQVPLKTVLEILEALEQRELKAIRDVVGVDIHGNQHSLYDVKRSRKTGKIRVQSLTTGKWFEPTTMFKEL